ncbi:Similar to Luciferin 4-monooxygenase (Photuris pensylvanica) [Cotesia congregata]|uniref:Similar to Luciferin 4-monooxygenase (Photuris pensylvanica) n=1 Tax=Cotesia congregata TaxID=51543 RepID=A0A8J2H6S3_COTCN|nr:Similar to Luciferin 4-monooxygenase (Photuris pensylvanica) [Cotesia congregata]
MPDGYYKIGERILNQFKKYPDFVGQIDGITGIKDTYADMGDRSIRCALWLKEQGVSPGDVVGICSKNHLDTCIPVYASFYIGAIINPWWDTCIDEELVKNLIETTQPKVLFIDENHAEIITRTITKMEYSLLIVVFGIKNGYSSFEDVLKTQSNEDVEKFECTRVEPKDPVFLIYTSGTSGFPKGVLHSYHSVAHMFRYYPDDGTPSIDLYFFRLCWISGTRMVLRSIIFKATMIVCDNLAEEDACKIIEKYKVTRLWLGTPILNRFTKIKDIEKFDLSSVKLLSYGGAAANGQIIKMLPSLFKNADISSRYGSTECGTAIIGSTRFDKSDSCGKVFFNVQIKVIDPDTNKILGPNKKGELCVLSPKLMISYWKNPAKTEEIVDSDVIPRIVENVIEMCPGVAEVAVVAKPSFEHHEVPMAFITDKEIIEFLEKNLSNEVKLLGGVCFLDKMPYTPSKKIAKHRLYTMAKTIC